MIVKIETCEPVIPTKGSNAGKQMFVINGQYWHKTDRKPGDTHVVLKEVDKDGKKYLNVQGYQRDTDMAIGDKIKVLTGHDAAYASAIAFLLK